MTPGTAEHGGAGASATVEQRRLAYADEADHGGWRPVPVVSTGQHATLVYVSPAYCIERLESISSSLAMFHSLN